jgi:hypothetical protein
MSSEAPKPIVLTEPEKQIFRIALQVETETKFAFSEGDLVEETKNLRKIEQTVDKIFKDLKAGG